MRARAIETNVWRRRTICDAFAEKLLVRIENCILPADDLFIDEKLKQIVILGNELKLTNRVYTMHLVPLLVAVRRKEHINDDIFEYLNAQI